MPRLVRFPAVRFLAVALAAVLPLAWVAPASASAGAAGAVACDYRFVAWPSGFVADLTITNHGPVVVGWTVRWTMPAATGNLSVWQAKIEQPDPFTMAATNVPYNAVIDTGRSVTFGWTASATTTAAPTDLTVNGTPC
ncbi:cellulose binding domain-containing protein [Dactylosporangium sp. NPDC049525]|uniref:cellulose binding domain-containing protein n=1 Tax=Dactylosporangium sp. NPDC049525 TaxID=3154730 RepID=UPI003423645E